MLTRHAFSVMKKFNTRLVSYKLTRWVIAIVSKSPAIYSNQTFPDDIELKSCNNLSLSAETLRTYGSLTLSYGG